MGRRIRHLPLRLATGAFILNAGLKKWKGDEVTAKGVHGFASSAYPQVAELEPEKFLKALAAAEIALGAALLVPVVPPRLVGLALTGFSGSLLGLYFKVPGMHEDGSLSPTQQGTPIAKDVWLLGIGLSLLVDG